MKPATKYLSTVMPAASVTTVTEYGTVSRTSVDYVFTTVPTTITTVETSTALEAVTATVSAVPTVVPLRQRKNTPPAITPLPHCPDLTEKLAGKPASLLSKACSCIVKPTTVTLSATTAPPVDPITVTKPVTSTVVATTGTVVTETTTAIFTASASPAPSCVPPGGRCTVENYETVCCRGPTGENGCFFPTGNPYDGICFD
ncbi:hypothetical protein QBC35DRAFT_508338 [Podospora australis]|uniref:Uncharacterized protein n=1 Tax=Podospora australis TaxID=1536484 RepID=A0AAN7AE61_9PEZI|nr:hypothetical protein QBC35DRAFT_508338 [Podospora australis]